MATIGRCGQKTVKNEEWHVRLGNQFRPVRVTFKHMKTVRLRIVIGGQIRLSAPHRTNREWLEHFLKEREQWILEQIEKMQRIPHTEMEKAKSMPPLTTKERREALAYLLPLVEKWYPVVAFHGVSMPHVTVRRMSSRYGSCSVGRGRITLAEILLNVPKECAEYVVFHELTHFLYPNHGKEFYQFIEKYMPDYRQREKQLKQRNKNKA